MTTPDSAPAIQTGRRELSARFDRLRAALADVERQDLDRAVALYDACGLAVEEMARRITQPTSEIRCDR